MAIILCIETSGPVCSVALWSSAQGLIKSEIHADSFDHAKVLSGLIDVCCKEAKMTLSDIDAIAVSAGPGSYTGLRIGVSTAKGLCFALDIPLIAIDTLKIMANQMLLSIKNNASVFVPMLDARRMEVFYGVYDNELNTLQKPEPRVIDESFFDSLSDKSILIGGSGSEKTVEMKFSSDVIRLDKIAPRAEDMGPLANLKYEQGKFEDVAYFEPWYTKAFYSPKRTT